MRKTIVQCDRCSNHHDAAVPVENLALVLMRGATSWGTLFTNYDICSACLEGLRDAVRAFLAVKE